jgi:hypothetical protein
MAQTALCWPFTAEREVHPSMWDLWWIKWYWDGSFSNFLLSVSFRQYLVLISFIVHRCRAILSVDCVLHYSNLFVLVLLILTWTYRIYVARVISTRFRMFVTLLDRSDTWSYWRYTCDATVMRWRYDTYDMIWTSKPGGDSLRRYALFHYEHVINCNRNNILVPVTVSYITFQSKLQYFFFGVNTSLNLLP